MQRSTRAGSENTRAPQSGRVVQAATPTTTQLVEALLFIGGAPLTADRAGEAIRGLDHAEFITIIQTLTRKYRQEGRPYAIHSRDDGYLLELSSDFKTVEERLYGLNREARLSIAAIDVLSLVAYRQPIGKQGIDGIRGADSAAALRQLLRRGLIRIAERKEPSRRDTCYETTQRFLDLFQLGSLDELPRTEDLEKI